MVYGYARVSTKLQAKDGNSLEAQEKALKEAGATKIYKDTFTGTVMEVVQLTGISKATLARAKQSRKRG